MCLGDDPRVAPALREALGEEGATLVDEQWGMAGGVEVTTTTFDIGGRRLVVEQETYEGITLLGDGELVRRIAARVRST